MLRTYSILFALACLCACSQAPSKPETGKDAVQQSSGHHSIVLSPAEFSRDSLIVDSLYERLWYFVNRNHADSMEISSKAVLDASDRLLQAKYDSATYMKHVFAYYHSGYVYCFRNQADAGLPIMEDAIKKFQQAFGENHIRLTEAYSFIMAPYCMKGDFVRAESGIRKTIEMTQRNDYGPGSIKYPGYGWSNLGLLYVWKGEPAGAIGAYRQALEVWRKTGATISQINTCGLLADLYGQTGDRNMVEYYYETGKKLCRESKEPEDDNLVSLCVVAERAALGFMRVQALPQARAAIREAQAAIDRLYREKPPQIPFFTLERQKASIECTKGKILLAERNYPGATQTLRQGYQLMRKAWGNGFGQTQLTGFNLAEAYLQQDSFDEAQAVIRENLSTLRKDWAQHLDMDRITIDQLPVSYLAFNMLSLRNSALFQEYRRKGNNLSVLKNAFRNCNLTIELAERLRKQATLAGSKTELQVRTAPALDLALAITYELYRRTNDKQYLNKAFEIQEKGKSILLLESLREKDAEQIGGIPPALREQERQINLDLAFYEKTSFDEGQKEKPDSALVNHAYAKRFELNRAKDSLIRVLERAYPAYYRLKYDWRVASIPDIQKRLDDQTGVVEYFLGDSVLFTFVISRSHCQFLRTGLDSSFQRQLASIRRIVHGYNPAILQSASERLRDYDIFCKASHELYQTLLARPLNTTQVRNLVIIPDGLLNSLPFSVLLTKAAPTSPGKTDYRNLPFLFETYNLRLEYSGTLLAEPQPREATSECYLAFAPVYPGQALASRGERDSIRLNHAFEPKVRNARLPALRFNTEEVREAANLVDGRVQADTAATEKWFKNLASRYRVLHLSMHAFTNDIDPLYSQFLFTQTQGDTTEDNQLHAYEIYNMRLQAQLAVLSACNTGAGKLLRGEGAMSLARAFKFAGCPNILMSLWSVNDATGKDIIVDYFRKLRSGLGKSAALQAVQRDFLHQTRSDEWTHPYYWATFILIGDDTPVRFGNRWHWAWVAGVLGLICVVAIHWHRRNNRLKYISGSAQLPA